MPLKRKYVLGWSVMFTTTFATLLLAGIPQSGMPEDPGPHPVGWSDISFQDQQFGQGLVRARIFYPATSSGQDTPADSNSGPYPLVNFMHGWLMAANDHDSLCTHLASHGYLIAATDTESGFFPDTTAYALDSQALLHWVANSSSSATHWLSGMADAGDWASVGHSMGGGTLSLLIGNESRVRTIIGLQAAELGDPGPANMRAFTGTSAWIAGSEDWVVPPAVVKNWYSRSTQTQRKFFYNVDGMGHMGCTDSIPNNEPLSAAEQMRVHKRLVLTFLNAEMRDADQDYEWIVGQGLAWSQPWTYIQECPSPVLWGGEQPTALGVEMGALGTAKQKCVVMGSLSTGNSSTPFGSAGLDLTHGAQLASRRLSGNGYGVWSQFLDPSLSGRTVYAQAAVFELVAGQLSGELSKVLSLQIP